MNVIGSRSESQEQESVSVYVVCEWSAVFVCDTLHGTMIHYISLSHCCIVPL